MAFIEHNGVTTGTAPAPHPFSGEFNAPLPLLEKVGFGVGEIAGNFSWTMLGGFILYYYTNVALLPVAALGLMLLITRGLDAFADPLIGLAMDRTRTRLGRARPYILYGCIPLGIFATLIFTSPLHGTFAKLAYAYGTLLLLGVLYSAVSIPYGALMPLMTKNTQEKVQLSSMRSIGSSVGAVAVTSLVMPMVRWFGGGNESRGFGLTALVFSATSTVLFLVVFFSCKERHIAPKNDSEPSVLGSIKDVAHNKMFLVCFFFALVHLVRIGGILTGTVYFALIVLHAAWAIPLLFGAMSVGSIVAATAATPYFSRFGFRRGNVFALLFAIAMGCILPFLESHPWGVIVCFAFLCVGAQSCTTAIFAMFANASDFHEFKFGSRADGLIYSSLSLSTKVGIALGGAIFAYGLSVAHYVPNAVTHESLNMIRFMFYVVPGILMVVQIIVVLFYKLDNKHTLIARHIATDNH